MIALAERRDKATEVEDEGPALALVIEPDLPTPDDVLGLIVRRAFTRAVQAVGGLAEGLGCDVGDIEAPVNQLVSDGILDRWEQCEAGEAVILSSFTARAHRLRLSDGWPLRWLPLGKQERKEGRTFPRWLSVEADLTPGIGGEPAPTNRLENIADARTPTPLAIVARAEGESRRAGRLERDKSTPRDYILPPRPAVLLGLSMVPDPWRPGECPHCGHWREMAKAPGNYRRGVPALCLACHWYSHDRLIPARIHAAVEASERRAEKREAKERKGAMLKGGIG